jgi:hypothetical protein
MVGNGFALETVIEMHEADSFLAEVSAYPAITVIRNGLQHGIVVAMAGREAENTPTNSLADTIRGIGKGEAASILPGLRAVHIDQWYQGPDPWPRVEPGELELLRHLENRFEPIGTDATSTKVGIGVASGCDRVYLTKDPSLVESTRLLPLAIADDLKTGTLEWSGQYLVNPWEEGRLVSLDDHPRLASYFLAHRNELSGRHCARGQERRWYRTIDRVDPTLAGRPKLYFPDIKGNIHPVLDHGLTYPHHNLYYVVSDRWDLSVLGGLLMSRIAQFFVECYSVRMRGGYLRFQAQNLRRIRIPRPEQVPEPQAHRLRKAFLTRDTRTASEVAAQLYEVSAGSLGRSP